MARVINHSSALVNREVYFTLGDLLCPRLLKTNHHKRCIVSHVNSVANVCVYVSSTMAGIDNHHEHPGVMGIMPVCVYSLEKSYLQVHTLWHWAGLLTHTSCNRTFQWVILDVSWTLSIVPYIYFHVSPVSMRRHINVVTNWNNNPITNVKWALYIFPTSSIFKYRILNAHA